MNPDHQNFEKSPHNKPSSDAAETTPLMGFQQFSMEDITFSDSPFIEFESFSPPLTTTTTSGGGDDDVEEEVVPHPLESLHENPIPPFLWKTYELVDDKNLDPMISWGLTGESFVVWDPLEFSRIILPRSFKHNNFSSFVRQLNTYGFRKINTDRWEFANEAFRRGKRHLLKNIRRRKSPQSQQVGSYTGPSTQAVKSGLESEVERLKKEQNMMMQEVVELQQQQHETVHHMEAVNQRIQAGEQRQRQMVSFLAKLFQNPAFLARLKQNKEEGDSGLPRIKRKFVRHQQHELGQSESSMEGQIVKYRPDWRNVTLSSAVPDVNPVLIEQVPNHVLQGMLGLGGEGLPFQFDNVLSEELAISGESAAAQGCIQISEQVGQGALSLGRKDPNFKGKNLMSPQKEVGPEYSVSFPEDLSVEKNFPEFFSSGIESIVKQEDAWSMGFDNSAGMPSSSNQLWGNLINYDVPELGLTGGFSDIWDLGSAPAPGVSGIDKWPVDENPIDEAESHAGQPKDDMLKKLDP